MRLLLNFASMLGELFVFTEAPRSLIIRESFSSFSINKSDIRSFSLTVEARIAGAITRKRLNLIWESLWRQRSEFQ
jgi:hypothetical protein